MARAAKVRKPNAAVIDPLAPDTARKEMDRITDVIKRKFGKEGREEIEGIFRAYQPNKLLNEPDTPALRNKLAAFIGDLNTVYSELAESFFYREQQARKAAELEEREELEEERREYAKDKRARSKGTKRRKKRKAKPEKGILPPVVAGDPPGTIKGKYDGFAYKVIPRGPAGWELKPVMRKIVQVPGAPDPYDVRKTGWGRPSDAEAAFRDKIREARIWHTDRGLTLRFLPPKRKKAEELGGRRVRPSYRPTRKEEREEEAKRAASEEKKLARVRKEREERDRRRKLERTQRRATAPVPRKRYHYVPKKNPSNPFSFMHSETSASKNAKKAFGKYSDYYRTFRDTNAGGRPDFRALMRAYDNIENARANYFLAGDEKRSEKANQFKRTLRNEILDSLKLCQDVISGKVPTPRGLGPQSNPATNPTKASHAKIGLRHFEKAERCWKEYCDDCKLTDLLNAYKHLEIACEELKHAGDKDGRKRASELAKLAKSEIKKRAKGK